MRSRKVRQLPLRPVAALCAHRSLQAYTTHVAASARNSPDADPIYVLDNNIPIDTRYYLENQLSGPLTRIFEGIIDNPATLFSGEHTRTIAVSVAARE